MEILMLAIAQMANVKFKIDNKYKYVASWIE